MHGGNRLTGCSTHATRPLASEQFKTNGVDLFVERLGKVINVSREGQLGMKAVLSDSLARIEYDKRGRAVRLFPMLRRGDAPKSIDQLAGNLAAKQALGGPENLAALSLTDPPGFTVYDAWQNAPGGGTEAARLSVARGQAIFDTRPISITGVGGLTDRVGTCAGCHRVSNMGNTAGFLVLNIGTSDEARRPVDLPLYTLRNLSTGQTVKTSDPGRAMVTGAWADIGKFKVPNLRALAARAPYFHAGTAGTLDGVVGFYNGRFSMGMSAQEKTDLANFLRTL